MEFIIAFVVTLVLLVGVSLALFLGKPPVYRPSREEIVELLDKQLQGRLDDTAWHMFINAPITHDPNLNDIRLLCYELEQEAEIAGRKMDDSQVRFSAGEFHYNPAGMERLEKVLAALHKVIETTPVQREF